MLCILGPTASGKSSLAMGLARAHPDIELISMDSALVYRGMDIGTAKPSPAERKEVPHHLIDIIDPTQTYSAARFIADAKSAAAKIRARQKIPVMVGGTMLYYKAFVEGLDDLPSAPSEIRESIAREAAAQGWPQLHRQLSAIDPETADRINPNDAQRISRALELYRFTGKTMSRLIAQSPARPTPVDGVSGASDNVLEVVALQPEDRGWLHARIELRFQQMLTQGFLDEVGRLMHREDLHPELPSMRAVGYRQAWEHLEGKTGFDEFVGAAVAATRQLAKRQITWLRSFDGIRRVDPQTSWELAHAMCNEIIGRG